MRYVLVSFCLSVALTIMLMVGLVLSDLMTYPQLVEVQLVFLLPFIVTFALLQSKLG